MKIILFIAISFIHYKAISQIPITEINASLKKGNFLKFKESLKKLKKNHSFDSWVSYYRDIYDDYKEGIISIQTRYYKNRPLHLEDSSYKIKIIVKKNKIINYEFYREKYRRTESVARRYSEMVDSFRNKIKFTNFKDGFKKIYKIDLVENDLNRENIIFGYRCGLPLSEIPEYKMMQTFVVSKQQDSLFTWLKSVNTEKQMFALFGLHKLNQSGLTFGKSEFDIINFVTTRKGMAQTCSGCEISNLTITEIAKEFKFN